MHVFAAKMKKLVCWDTKTTAPPPCIQWSAPYSRFSVRYRTRYAMRKKWIATCRDSCGMRMRIRMGKSRNWRYRSGFPWISTTLETVSRSVPMSVVPVHSIQHTLHGIYAPCSSRLLKMFEFWTHQPRFLFFNFSLHIKWYAIAMIIEPLCSNPNGKRCNTDRQGGMLWLGGPRQKDCKSHRIPYIRILSCRIPQTTRRMRHTYAACRV